MVSSHHGTIESTLTNCFTVWFGGYTANNQKPLQPTVSETEKIIGASLLTPCTYTAHLARKRNQHSRRPHPPLTWPLHLRKVTRALMPAPPVQEIVSSTRL